MVDNKYNFKAIDSVNFNLLKEFKIVFLGYGNQARAQALNLRDSGIDPVIALREGSQSIAKAEKDSFVVQNITDAVKSADFILLLIPDEEHGKVFNDYIVPFAKKGVILSVAHGYSLHYNYIDKTLRPDIHYCLLAPKVIATYVRNLYQNNQGFPCCLDIQDLPDNTQEVVKSYLLAITSGKAHFVYTSFKDETEADLFGEQAVLCGGMISIIKTAFSVLESNGYSKELAYIECIYELKFIIDSLLGYADANQSAGIAKLYSNISKAAFFGSHKLQESGFNDDLKIHFEKVLANIKSSKFSNELEKEKTDGYPFVVKAMSDSLVIKIDNLINHSKNSK